MDEKPRLPLHHPRADMTTPVRRRRTRLWVPILALVLIGYSLLSTYNVDVRSGLGKLSKEAKSEASKAVSVSTGGRRKVPLEAHIISKCPDTRVCIRPLCPSRHRFAELQMRLTQTTGCLPRTAPPCYAAGRRQG